MTSTSLRKDISLCSSDDGMVILDERTGRYWQLNITGARILSGLLAGATPQEVSAQLASSHDVTEERASADVRSLLEQLAGAKIVSVS
ncbi:lasso peptide biosynthesis PqqD family chaperone [Streptomyces sp. NPDC002044]|uniref:lasso peptide biosynthesis PqqD family chaperone n=1 Tax=Streptomyces sp. NPDC002044 TaxID=3154662 RepID=UPI003331CA76